MVGSWRRAACMRSHACESYCMRIEAGVQQKAGMQKGGCQGVHAWRAEPDDGASLGWPCTHRREGLLMRN